MKKKFCLRKQYQEVLSVVSNNDPVVSKKIVSYINIYTRNCGSTTDKGCSVLRIACDMPVSLVTECITTIILNHLCSNYYYYYYHLLFLQVAGIVPGVRTRLEMQSYSTGY